MTETKRTEYKDTEHGFVETTEEALSSVEVGQDAKGNRYVKSVKVYHNDPLEAGRLATIVLDTVEGSLRLIDAKATVREAGDRRRASESAP